MNTQLLPVITCDDCNGACCRNQPTPPGYTAVLSNPDGWPPGLGDHERVAILAREDPKAIEDIYDAMAVGDDFAPCCWLDLATGRCRYYEYRPAVCRDFHVGSNACLRARATR